MEEAYLRTSCPACDQHIEVPTELAGQSVACPTCEHQFVVAKSSAQAKQAGAQMAYWSGDPARRACAVLCKQSCIPADGVHAPSLDGRLAPIRLWIGVFGRLSCGPKESRDARWRREVPHEPRVTGQGSCVPRSIAAVGWIEALERRKVNLTGPSRGNIFTNWRSSISQKFKAVETAIKRELVSPATAKFEDMARIIYDQDDYSLARVEDRG